MTLHQTRLVALFGLLAVLASTAGGQDTGGGGGGGTAPVDTINCTLGQSMPGAMIPAVTIKLDWDAIAPDNSVSWTVGARPKGAKQWIYVDSGGAPLGGAPLYSAGHGVYDDVVPTFKSTKGYEAKATSVALMRTTGGVTTTVANNTSNITTFP